MNKLKMMLALAVGAGVAMSGFAAPHSAADAVKQQIVIEPVQGLNGDFLMGVDLSQVAEIEGAGGKYFAEDGSQKDVFQILKEDGANCVRLRVWNNPTYNSKGQTPDGRFKGKKGDPLGGGNNSVDVDIPMAKRAKDAGMKLCIDFHYSDFWADPAKQAMPQDWAKLKGKKLNAAVEAFTAESLKKFIDAGARPDLVQIGNELNNGFMWPAGKIWGAKKEKVGGMKGFIGLLKSAAAGVRTAEAGGDKIKIVVHLADGGDNGLYHAVFDPITKAKLDFDVIGLSFYPYWHGSSADLLANITDLSKSYGKEMIVAETAYAFTTEDGDKQGNVFQVFSKKDDGYAPTVQGQATEVRDIIATVASVQGGIGVFYWEPAAIMAEGVGLSAHEGNTWENQAMFDYTGKVLPSAAVWKLVKGGDAVSNSWGGSAKNGSNFIPYAMADASLKVFANPGDKPKLPEKIKVLLTNDRESLVDVTWDDHDWASTKDGDEVNLNGSIAGQSYKPVIKVLFSSKINVVDDPSFESGQLGKWNLNGPGAACFMENNKSNAHTGDFTYKYWLDTPFKATLSQTIEGLADGDYVLSVWAMGGTDVRENSVKLFAKGFDKADPKKQASVKISHDGWQKWKQYTVDVPVTNGKATIGIYLDAAANCWGNFDDIEFYKK